MRRHLGEVLGSPAFRGSERCKQFLQFVVERALEGRLDELKERVLGREIFQRTADYETSADAIVRVKANEVRKRLAQYYSADGPSVVQIDLLPGSYVPEFRWVQSGSAVDSPAVQPAPAGWLGRWAVPAVATLAVLVGAGVYAWRRGTAPTELDRFWAPVVQSAGTPFICMGDSSSVSMRGRLMGQWMDAPPGSRIVVERNDVAVIPNGGVSMGNFHAAMALAGQLERRGKTPQVRPSSSLGPEDFRQHPIIHVGAFNNAWTLRHNASLRFEFFGADERSGAYTIRDRLDPKISWQVPLPVFPWGSQTIDYAVVSRVFDRSTGNVLLTLAGINTFGTRAAGEFVSNPIYWGEISRRAPSSWEKLNVQIVLETSVVGSAAGPPKVVAAHFWRDDWRHPEGAWRN